MRINNNIMAMNAHRQYSINTASVAKSTEKLSSGYRINRAGDDAAGLAISEKMRAQIRGLTMASKNSSDAISMIQTAEGALQSAHDILQRMRELAVQSASDTNETSIDRSALQQEFDQLKKELNDISTTTRFNDQNLLDGTFQSKISTLNNTTDASGVAATTLTGVNAVNVDRANAGKYDMKVSVTPETPSKTIDGNPVDIGDADLTALAGMADKIDTVTFDGLETAAHNGNKYTLYVTGGDTSKMTFQLKDTNGNLVATAQNVDASGWTSKSNNTVSFTGVGTFTFNLVTDEQVTSVDDLTRLSGAELNFTGSTEAAQAAYDKAIDDALAGDTGYDTAFNGSLEQSEVYGDTYKAEIMKSTAYATEMDSLISDIEALATGTDDVAIAALSTEGKAYHAAFEALEADDDLDADITATLTQTLDAAKAAFMAADSSIDDAIAAVEADTPTNDTLVSTAKATALAAAKADPEAFTAAVEAGADAYAGDAEVKEAAIEAATAAQTEALAGGKDPQTTPAVRASMTLTINGDSVTLYKGDTYANFASQGISFEFDALSDEDIKSGATRFGPAGTQQTDDIKISVNQSNGKTMIIQTGANEGDELGININKISTDSLGLTYSNISNQASASDAITEVNTALNEVSTQRAALGALQNRLEYKIASLDTSAENLSSAESRIRDLDIAKEMTNFTKNNILVQASTAMLAQANAAPQGVLQLLG